MGITIPTKARFMNHKEYEVVTRVMGDTLPYRIRIIVTNGAGVDERPFTIPTALVDTLLKTAAAPFLAPVTAVSGYLSSFMNAGYLMNVGSAYPDMLFARSRNDARLAGQKQHFRAQLCFQFLLKSMSFGRRGV